MKAGDDALVTLEVTNDWALRKCIEIYGPKAKILSEYYYSLLSLLLALNIFAQ